MLTAGTQLASFCMSRAAVRLSTKWCSNTTTILEIKKKNTEGSRRHTCIEFWVQKLFLSSLLEQNQGLFLIWQVVSRDGQIERLQRKTEELQAITIADNHPHKTAEGTVVSWSLAVLKIVLAVTILTILWFLHHYMNIQIFLEFRLDFGLGSNMHKGVS